MAKRNLKNWQYVLVRVGMVFFDILLILTGTLGVYLMTNGAGSFEFDLKSMYVYWILGNLVLAAILFYFARMYTMLYVSVGFPEALRIVVVTGIIALVNLIK